MSFADDRTEGLPRVVHVRRRRARTVGAFVDPEYVLQFAEEADCEFRLETEAYRIRSGHAILMPPHLPHALRPFGDGLAQYVVVHFSLPPTSMLLAGFPLVVRLDPDDRDRFSSLADCMISEWHSNRRGAALVVAGLMAQMLGIYYRGEAGQAEAGASSPRAWGNVTAAIALIHEQCDGSLTIDDLSGAAKLSPSHFCRVFREYTGLPPHHYLNHVRVDRAKDLLCRGEMNCTQIGQHLGFSTVHAFSKTFKRHAGLSPRNWLRTYLARYRGL